MTERIHPLAGILEAVDAEARNVRERLNSARDGDDLREPYWQDLQGREDAAAWLRGRIANYRTSEAALNYLRAHRDRMADLPQSALAGEEARHAGWLAECDVVIQILEGEQ